ncbi:hypothetical protein ZWY2020_037302 [Hordeum vulgare]|nr:hypothetical protein ZWY2020_037302 [Hordeum vulgare]
MSPSASFTVRSFHRPWQQLQPSLAYGNEPPDPAAPSPRISAIASATCLPTAATTTSLVLPRALEPLGLDRFGSSPVRASAIRYLQRD